MKLRRDFTFGLLVLALVVACAGEPASEPEAETAGGVVMKMPVTTESAEARASFLAGMDASDRGRFTEAREHFIAATSADPDFALAYLGTAFVGNSLSEFSDNLKKAAEKAPGASEAERAWIMAARKGFDNDLEGALAESQRLVDLAPESPRAWLQLGFAQQLLGRSEEARATAMKALEVAPDFAPAHQQLGNSYLQNEPKDFAKAEEHFSKVVQLLPDEQYSHDLLGDVHRAQGDLEAARSDYTKAAELAPDDGSPLQQRGHVNSFLGNYDQARADYQRAMDLSEPDVAANFGVWKALVSVHAGEPQAAIEELEALAGSAEEMGVEDVLGAQVNALSNAAQIAIHHGLFDTAASLIERCDGLMMQQAEAVGTDAFRRGQEAQLAFLEGMLAARQGDYATARAKAEEMMKTLEPDANPRKNEPAHELMGLASLLEGKHEEAVGHYLQANPDDVYARYHLALAHEGAGNSEEANRIFSELAKHNFNFVGYALIRKDTLDRVGA